MKKIFFISTITLFLLAASVHALSFYPTTFNAWTGSAISAGNSIRIPLYIQNLGLLPDSYTIRVSVPEEYSTRASIENPSLSTSVLKTNDVDNINIKLYLSSNSVPIKILVYSNSAPILRYLEVTANVKPSYWLLYLATVLLLGAVIFLL